jgi:hypothetical protein
MDDAVLYVHISLDEVVRPPGVTTPNIVVQHKYRRLADMTTDHLLLLACIQRSTWQHLVNRLAVTKFLRDGWTVVKTCCDTGGYSLPENIRIVRVIHIVSYPLSQL